MNQIDVVTLAVLLFGAFSILAAVVGNALVLAAIWRNPSIRTPSYVLLAVLASTDLLTGLIAQPIFIASKLAQIRNRKQQSFCVLDAAAAKGILRYLVYMTVFTTTFMSIERYLHMARQSLLTVRRVCITYLILLTIPLPFVAIPLNTGKDCHQPSDIEVATAVVVMFCLSITSVAYFKVYRIIQHHQQQVHSNEPTQNYGQPAINLAKYKRSVWTILYVLMIFYLTYIPCAVFLIFSKSLNKLTHTFYEVFNLLIALFLISSSLNPILYYLRMKDISNGVKQIVKKIVCKTD